ncbi:MAG TPA: threonine synthase [Planctomycetota bacterium]|nr:threonine synthase [Planctomycetota bacterium]
MPASSTATGLSCRRCLCRVPLGALESCPTCAGTLVPTYDIERAARSMSDLDTRPRTMWRYSELLPVDRPPGFGEGIGWTPLIDAPRLARALGLRSLFLKNEGVCHPTCSFKDRPVAVAVAAAQRFGFRVLAAPSTGNLANATAALARLAGLEARVFVPADLEEAKIAGAAVFGPGVLAVRGSYDEVRRLAATLAARESWALVNHTLRPFYGEGSKTIAFEAVEQLGGLPEQVLLPMGSGLLLDRVARGFEEWGALRAVSGPRPRMCGVQAQGCAPIAEAFRRGEASARPVRPRTIARSIAVGEPASAVEALEAIRGSGGTAVSVSDEEILEGTLLLARTEGIFGETACGASVAGARRLVEEGGLDRDARTLLVLTGNGFKTADALRGRLAVPVVRADPTEAMAALRSSTSGVGPSG